MKSFRIRPIHLCLILIVLASLIVRCGLVLDGGQLFNPDEYRYLSSRIIAHDLLKHHYRDAMVAVTQEVPHLGFKIVGVLPALWEMTNGKDLIVPGLFFSLFSSANIVIIWFMARRLGSDEREALWAALLMATSNALFYYASHLFPYDLAMTFGLLSLYVGLRTQFSAWTSILAGMLGFAAFFTYNGYWPLVAFALAAHVLCAARPDWRTLLKALLGGIGFVAPFLLVVWLGRLYGNDLWKSYLVFSSTITNGRFSDGAVLPFAYFWVTEHAVLIIWLALFLYAIALLRGAHPPRILVWLAGVLFVYACLAIPSVVLHQFVVYGRLARQLVPFFALTGAYSLRSIDGRGRTGRIVLAVIIPLVIVQAAVNFRAPLLITYPADFAKEAQARYPDFHPPSNLTFFYTANVIDAGPYKAYYIRYIYPLPEKSEAVQGEILMSAENPLSYAPFRYEDEYPLDRREFFPSADFAMRVVKAGK